MTTSLANNSHKIINNNLITMIADLLENRLGISTSLAGADCYTVYKATSEPSMSTTADIVMPWIADTIAFAIASQYVTLDMSSTATAMQSVKQCMSVVSTVVATDYMSRVVIDMMSVGVKEAYEHQVVDYMTEVYVYGIDNLGYLMNIAQEF